MAEPTVTLLEQRHFGSWGWFTLQAATLAAAQPGQYVALRCAAPGSFDPLIRTPVFVAATDVRAGTCSLLAEAGTSAATFLRTLSPGTALDVLGPLGHGWQVDQRVRTVVLVGTHTSVTALFGLAHAAAARGLAVSMLLGASDAAAVPPPFFLPASVEYHVVSGDEPVAAALQLLDTATLQWADLLAVALPQADLPALAERVRRGKLRWERGFAQTALLQPLVCCVGVCDVCQIETRRGRRLGCVDGPVFDLRDLTR